MKTWTKLVTVVTVVYVLSLISVARGAVSLEATYDNNADLTLGTPATGTLLGDASVSGGKLLAPQGSSITGVNYGDVTGSGWFDMTNLSSWGTNTMVGIFTLDTLTQQGGQQSLASVAYRNQYNGNSLWSAGDGIDFLAGESSNMPQIVLSSNWGTAVLRCNMYTMHLVTGVEYFTAASWQDNGNGTISMTIYLRQTDDLTGSNAYYSSGTVASPGAPQKLNVSQFVTGYAPYGVTPNGTLGGGINLIQVYAGDFQVNKAAYETLFTNVVPEPATLFLLGIGAALLRRRIK